MALRDRPSTLKDMQELALRIESRFMERALERGRFMGNPNGMHLPTATVIPDDPDRMQIDHVHTINPEKERRTKLGLCWTCGAKGHLHDKCPEKGTKNGRRQ
ncbi:uncharacterized protein V1513DRAFT_434548 [Lipomyces chichibuensis]|uniref:uncharacterized protein n=1 Tax=Lipomyces chichibuensis TaxID=1546026 RepID=UPI0033435786